MPRQRQSRTILAVDPGEAWRGLARLEVGRHPLPCAPDCYGHSADGRMHLRYCVTFSDENELYEYLRSTLWSCWRLVLERFRLYPWMARQQGFSSFGTAECIGVCKYIADSAGIPCEMQDPSGNLKEGRKHAKADGFPMADRKLGSGQYAYYGPDFDLPGRPHRRDAAAHAVQFAHVSGLLDNFR